MEHKFSAFLPEQPSADALNSGKTLVLISHLTEHSQMLRNNINRTLGRASQLNSNDDSPPQ